MTENPSPTSPGTRHPGSTSHPGVWRNANKRWAGLSASWPVVLVLGVMAYIPALWSSPGRMPADSKLYLYLNPGRFLGDAASSFDPRQFAGWVPHQHIAYLWPAGPYYWLADTVGLPDWVAHRLWIGSLMFAAGTGMWWCARRFGFGIAPALAGAAVYQCSLYILPYVSRTSVMLLPWAGLGWILGLTVQATRQQARRAEGTLTRRQRWRYPALIALVVYTVGSVNATALAMITPAPALWLAYWAIGDRRRWRPAFAIALRTGATCIAVSVWWMMMLVIQGRYGAEVLPFSETLQDVSFTSTAPEVWRGLGYWLFYIRDFAGPTTTESLIYLVSGTAIMISFAIPIVGLIGLAWTNWAERRFAWLLVGVGGVLAVGVYPFESPSPLMALITGNGSSGLALALRSSTRAVPVMMVGVALGIAALCEAVPADVGAVAGDGQPDDDASMLNRWHTLSPRTVAAALVVLIALVNVPSLRHHQLVDPMLERAESPPPEWTQAAATISGSGSTEGRVLQVPGIEFGAYRWGFTVDQPLPGLADKPLVTRDLLPLGSAAAMDVLYALDDRIQDGTVTTEQFEAAAHVLGVDTIWLTGDLAFDRFETARPVDVRDVVEQLGTVTGFGEPRVNTPRIVWSDERSVERPQSPIAPVELIDLDRASTIVRAAPEIVAVSGSGDGVVASTPVAAAAQRAALVYTADRGPDPLDGVAALVVTDSNRNRNRQWRSSHDSVGATLTADDPISLVERDQRLPVFDNTSTDTQTVAVQEGPLQAYASRYGEPFGYQPERRAAMAIDGDPATAWTVGEHGDPLGASLVLEAVEPVQSLDLHQFLPIPGQRQISQLRIDWDPPAGTSEPEASVTDLIVDIPSVGDLPGDAATKVQLPMAVSGRIEIEITAVDGGEPLTEGIVADVGFTEVVAANDDGILAPTVEWIRTPVDATGAVPPDLPVAYALRRERVDPLNHWRSDPEPTMRRIIEVGAPDSYDLSPEVRLDAAVADRELADLLGAEVWASNRLDGSLVNWGAAAFDGAPDTAWVSGFGRAGGSMLHLGKIDAPISRLTISQPFAELSKITSVIVDSGRVPQSAAVTPDVNGLATVELDPPLAPGDLTLTVDGIEPENTIDRRFGDLRQLPVAIAEITVNGAPGRAPGVPPATECVDIVTIDGNPYRGRLQPLPSVLQDRAVGVEMCDVTAELAAGQHRIGASTPEGFVLDGVDLRNPAFGRFDDSSAAGDGSGQGAAVDRDGSDVDVTGVSGDRFDRDVELNGCREGCWLIFGEGYNRGWKAEIDGRSLGPPTLVDGTSNGWWISASDTDAGSVSVRVRWSEQGALTTALWFSLIAVLACLVIAATTPPVPVGGMSPVAFAAGSGRLTPGSTALIAVGAVVSCALVVGFDAWPIGVVVGLMVALTRRVWPLTVAPALLVAFTAVSVARAESIQRYTPDALWPRQFTDLHTIAMSAFALALVVGLVPPGTKPQQSADGD